MSYATPLGNTWRTPIPENCSECKWNFAHQWQICRTHCFAICLRLSDYNPSTIPPPPLHLLWRCGPTLTMASSFLRFLDHTQRRITVGRTPLDAWSVRRRDLYLTTHNRQTSMSRWNSNPWSQQALDSTATGTGSYHDNITKFCR